MPTHIKLIARYGNGVAALFFGVFTLALVRSNFFAAVIMIAFCALALFNIYVIEICRRFFSEEEMLKTEIRKAELRHKLAGLNANPDAMPPRGSAS